MADAELNSENVTVGQPVSGGAVWTSFADSPTLPTDATTKMSDQTEWESCGELSDDGISEATDASSNDFKGWHGSTVLTTIDSTTQTYELHFIETGRSTVAKLRYGADNVTVGTDGAWTVANQPAIMGDIIVPLVIDELESSGYLRRTVIPKAKISNIGDTDHQKGSLLAFDLTFTALDPGDGVNVHIYRAKPSTTTPTTTAGE